jgi:hypothetical protein
MWNTQILFPSIADFIPFPQNTILSPSSFVHFLFIYLFDRLAVLLAFYAFFLVNIYERGIFSTTARIDAVKG